ncbi:glutathione transferase GstA [Shimwellia pseudoproteus]|uniref:glutathione transferase GstA n=1 Tax=Shimwellia pseudoproteus TaxID=570012 RepID=UPI0018ED711D|nr:glutathione transferase GstA [Shimwellia pseudoproteus]MBJ3814027.1 glutathione transferase GstA [Shimwellia pseudoproteus]
MKLYYKPGACSLSPHIVLREAGLDFTLERVDLASKKTEFGEDYLRINPKGQVPALLLDSGDMLTEGVAIVQYLADQVPDRNLIAPAGTLARYHAIESLNFIATELHKGFSPLFTPGVPEAYQKMATDRLLRHFALLDTQLSEHDYLQGSRFSVADAYLFTVLNWAFMLKLDLSHLPALQRYYQRIAARPAVAAALAAEGLQ